MKKIFFKTVAQLNKLVLPRISNRNLNKLSKFEKAVVAFRYWVTVNSLD
ncbi:MAG: hypothetical protein KF775_06670 [Cyclobacteriaceae bacterium]|nr:hypothetical protein [Cyclobacteriaceae bacterium]